MRVRKAVNAGLAAVLAASVGLAGIPAYATESQWREGGGLVYPYGKELSTVADNGVATYVGGNFLTYEWAKSEKGDSIKKSRAAEVEGLTVIGGYAGLGSDHNGGWYWGDHNFRFGAAGLGSGYSPERGDTALAVGVGVRGVSCDMAVISPAGSSSAFFSAAKSDNVEYRAQVAGNEKGCGFDMRNTLHANADGTRRDWIQYQKEPLKNVNGRDYSGYSGNIKSQSSRLAGLKDTGTVEYGVAPADTDYWRTNYMAEDVSYKFVFEGEDGNHQFAEKLVTFKGDNKSSVQVFTVDEGKLDTEGWHGVSFKFEGIPADAAVVVNVKGDAVRFDNGWRFWWNGTEVGNAWGKGVDASVPAAFKTAASSIMWNFPDAENVTIQGGRLNNGDTRDGLLTPDNSKYKVRWGDPSAEFIGSILVPNGNLKTEVSTNGRVATGGDYTMSSGTNTDRLYSDGTYPTRPSVMQMEQERHNFPWIGRMHLDAVDVSWKKSDDNGNLLKGSRWQVYSTLKDAENHTNPLLSVTDNDDTDLDSQEGSIAVGNLEPGYDYFVREILAPQGHNMSEHIYVADPDTGKLAGIGDAAGANILNGDTVKNGKTTEVGWVKYDGSKAAGDETAMLKGSEWRLNGNAVKDSTEEPKTVTVSRKGENVDTLTLFRGESAQLYANVAPENAPKSVTWSSSNGSVATVDGGLVTAGESGETVVKVSSKANPGVFKEVKVTVVGEFDIKNGEEVYKNGGTYAVAKGNHDLSLTVDADRIPYMTSSDVNVAKVKDGVLQALTPGTTRLSYTAGGKERSFFVTVVPEDTTAVFFSNRHGNNIYKVNTGESTGEIMCHDERKPVCTPEITEVKYEDNILDGQVTAESPDWSVVYVPNKELKAFDFVVGAQVGRYNWESNGAAMQSVEIKAMRGPNHSNFHVPDGAIAVWMENWDRSGVGTPAELKPSRSGDVRVTDAEGNRVYSGTSRVLDTGSEAKYTAQVVQGTSDSDSRMYWKSSAPDVVSVTNDGKLQAKKAGIADVYAITPKGSSQWIQFHVVDPGMVAVYADPSSSQTYANCTEDDPCGVRRNNSGYRTWSSYSSDDNVISKENWDSRDKAVLTNGVNTKYRVDGRVVRRVDVPVEAIKGLWDKPSGSYNGVNYWSTYLVSRQNEMVQCSAITGDSTDRSNCIRDTGGSFRSEAPIGAWGVFNSPFGGYNSFTYYDGDRIVLNSYNYSLYNYKTQALPPIDSMPGLTDEEKATLPEQDTDFEDVALNLPKQVNPQWEDTDTRPGVFSLGNVTDGDYTLEETKAPEGYTLLDSPVTFKVKDNQVFWKEGIPVVENVAWIANTKTGAPDTPGTPSNPTPNTPQQGTPSKPGQPSTPQASEDTPKKTVKLSKTGTSVAGVFALAFMCLLGGYGALQYRRYYWKR